MVTKKKKILSLKLPRNGASTQQTNVKSPLLQITFVTNTIQQSVAYELEFCKNWQNIIKQAPGFVHEVDKGGVEDTTTIAMYVKRKIK